MLGGLLAAPDVAHAQNQSTGNRSQGRIHGAIEDSTGAPIPQVSVGFVGTSTETTTDATKTVRPATPGVGGTTTEKTTETTTERTK